MKISRMTMVVGLAIPIASVVFFVLALFQTWSAPEHSDWKKAAGVVTDGFNEGDLVAFSPQWAQGASPWLQGLEVDTAETHDWYNASLYERVWLIESMNGLGPRLPAGWKRIRRQEMGKVAVSLWEPPEGQKVLYSFRERIGDATISRIRGKTRKFCTNFKNDRWYCGGTHPWQYVGHESRDIDGRVRDIIWAHAIEKSTVEALWPEVPRGRTLTVHYGLTQRAAEAREGADTTFRITLNGRTLFEDTLKTDEHGWFRRDFNFEGSEPASVGFQVETPDPQSRQVCFTAEVWK